MPPKSTKRTAPRVHAPRNKSLVQGLNVLSRSASFAKSGRWAIKNKATKKTAAKAAAVAAPATGWYAADDVRQKLATSKTNRPTVLRKSLTPGTVLINLAGRFRGKRVVMLKALASGMLLVTGPYKINGVPLRRVNPAYVVATSTKLDLSKVTVDAKFTDSYFAKAEKADAKKSEEAFFAQDAAAPKKELSAERKADQKAVDAQLMPLVAKTPLLKHYLNARFSLKKGQAPHKLQF